VSDLFSLLAGSVNQAEISSETPIFHALAAAHVAHRVPLGGRHQMTTISVPSQDRRPHLPCSTPRTGGRHRLVPAQYV
jgi:hypothetical protein